MNKQRVKTILINGDRTKLSIPVIGIDENGDGLWKDKDNTQLASNVKVYQNLVSRQYNGHQVGCIFVELPTNKQAPKTMTQTTIKGYNYAGGSDGTSWKVEIEVYFYNTISGTYNYSARIYGKAPFSKVRIADDGTRRVFILGDIDTGWDYPCVTVTHFIASYTNVGDWNLGWEIDIRDNLTGINNIKTPETNTIGIGMQLSKTYTELSILKNNNLLIPGMHYLINEQSFGTLGNCKILLHAIETNKLSFNNVLLPSSITETYDCEYDFDSNSLFNVKDNNGNNISGHSSIIDFPWFNASVYNINLDRSSKFVYSGGVVYDTDIFHLSTLTVSGGTVARFSLDNYSMITINSGTNYEVVANNRVTLEQDGTGTLIASKFENGVSVKVGNVNIQYSQILNQTNLVLTGTSGLIKQSRFNKFYGVYLTDVVLLNIYDSNLDHVSTFDIRKANKVYLNRCNLTSGCRFYALEGSTLNASYTTISNYGYLKAFKGTLTVNFCTVSKYSYITNNTDFDNLVERTDVNNSSYISFLGTSKGNKVSSCNLHAYGRLYITDCNDNIYQYNDLSNAGRITATGAIEQQILYCDVTAAGYIYLYSNQVGSRIRYCTVGSGGRISVFDNSSIIELYMLSVNDVSYLRITGSTANARLYYSNFNSYFYAYIKFTNAITSSGLFGSGRETYSKINPGTGSSTKNF